MTVSVFNSAQRVVKMAMFNAGLLEDTMDPDTDQLGNYLQRLSDMVNFWATTGCKLQLIQDVTIPLVAGQSQYTLGPGGSVNMTKPLRVEDGYYLYNDGTKRDLFPVSRQEWDRLSNVDSAGSISQWFEDRKLNLLYVNFWSTPSAAEVASGTVRLAVRTQPLNYTAGSDTIGFPPEWYMALQWGLAAEICTGQPDSIVQRCESKAAYYKEVLEGFDVEPGGVRFEPDAQGGFQSSFS